MDVPDALPVLITTAVAPLVVVLLLPIFTVTIPAPALCVVPILTVWLLAPAAPVPILTVCAAVDEPRVIAPVPAVAPMTIVPVV